MPTERKPTEIDRRPPYMMRLYVSRPKWSVPSQCSLLGGCSRLRRSCLFGSWVLRRGANTAVMMMSSSITTPKSVRGLRQKRRRAFDVRRGDSGRAVASAIAHPQSRVEVSVEDVNEEVDDCIGERKYENHTLDDREVFRPDRVDREPADARPGEDGFRDDGSGKQSAELQADYGDDRNQGVAEGVPVNDAAALHAFGAGRADIVLAHRFNQRGAGHAGNRSDGARSERRRGQDVILPAVAASGCREPFECERKKKNHDQRLPEHRHGQSEEGREREEMVGDGVRPRGGDDS